MEKVYIGVYGTLKKGYHANRILENSRFVGEFDVNINFKMYSLVAYPALVEDDNTNNIHLEIYEVDNKYVLANLDRYEGYPSLYQKSKIKVENMEVIIYTMKKEGIDFDKLEIVESGNWTK